MIQMLLLIMIVSELCKPLKDSRYACVSTTDTKTVNAPIPTQTSKLPTSPFIMIEGEIKR